MVCHVDLETVVTGVNAALFGDAAVVGIGFALVVVITAVTYAVITVS
ncbi:hypothetical protein [Neisseria yangbaofengii]|nr:hypothetical protein [Neisseria yangbaofengii]